MKEFHFGFKQIKAHPTNIRLRLKKKEEFLRKYCINQRRNVMEESINKFLNYCEKTGKRPEKVSIDDKTYIIEWHPNKMLKRIYPKPLSLGEIEVFYASNQLLCQGTTSRDVRKILRHHK